jgi:hypothetical protein
MSGNFLEEEQYQFADFMATASRRRGLSGGAGVSPLLFLTCWFIL